MGQVIDMQAMREAKMMNETAIDKLKREWNENPLVVIGVFAAAFTALSKLVDSISSVQGRRAYARQVQHRTKTKR